MGSPINQPPVPEIKTPLQEGDSPGGIVSGSPWGDPAIPGRSLAAWDRALRVQRSNAPLVEPGRVLDAPTALNQK